MSLAAKRRVFLVVLAALLVWPLVHDALSRRFRIDHWRFSGFAMYARPPYEPSLRFAGVMEGRPLSQGALREALGDGSARVDRFLARRRLWGELASPDELARLILARLPALPELTITVVTRGLEPGDDTFSTSIERYACARRPVACTRVP